MTILRGINLYAKTISILFYPSLLQALMASVLVNQPVNFWWIWIFFLILPVLFSWLYLKSIKMPKIHKWVIPKEFRILPLTFALMGNVLFYILFCEKEAFFVKAITLSSVLLTAFALLITYFWKISLHMIGMGAFSIFLVFFFQFNFWVILLVLVLSQQVAWARIYLKSHDIWQILAGYFLGLTCFALAYYLLH